MIFRNPANRPFVEDDAFRFSERWHEPGGIKSAWRKAAAHAAGQERETPYAWSERYGYLSPVPSHAGCGIEVSVRAHLVGMSLIGEDFCAFTAIEAMRHTATCTDTEGIHAVGKIHTIASAGTLGRTEEEFLTLEEALFEHLLHQELNARAKLLHKDRAILEDAVARSLAILSNARLMSRWELADLLSPVYFAVQAGLVEGLSIAELETMFLTQIEKGEFRQEPHSLAEERERDREDAIFAGRVRRRFAKVRMK